MIGDLFAVFAFSLEGGLPHLSGLASGPCEACKIIWSHFTKETVGRTGNPTNPWQTNFEADNVWPRTDAIKIQMALSRKRFPTSTKFIPT